MKWLAFTHGLGDVLNKCRVEFDNVIDRIVGKYGQEPDVGGHEYNQNTDNLERYAGHDLQKKERYTYI